MFMSYSLKSGADKKKKKKENILWEYFLTNSLKAVADKK